MWQKRPGELDHRLRFETEEMTLQMQQAVQTGLAVGWLSLVGSFKI